MYKIYVNDIQIDTYDINNIIINALLFDISIPANRGVKSSNKIIIPKTAKNIRIFEFYDEDIFFKTYKADIYDDTIHLIHGDVKVIETKDNITIQITEIFKSLSELFKKPMYELDISSADFTFNMTNFNTLHAATTGTFAWEYLYTPINTISPFPTMNVNIGILRPTYIVKSLIEKIFTDAGFSVDTSDLDSVVSDLRMLSNANDFWIAFYQVTHTSTTLTAGTSLPLPTATGGSATVDFIWDTGANNDFDNIINPEIRLNSGATHYIDNTKFVIEVDIDEEAELQILTKDLVLATPQIYARYNVKKTTTIITEQFNHEVSRYFEFQFDKNVTINRIRVICLAEENEIHVSSTIHTWVDGSVINSWYRQSSGGGGADDLPILEGFYVKAQYNLPDWTQYEFLKEIWSMFNIDIEIRNNTVYLKHKTLDDMTEINDYIVDRKPAKNNTLYAAHNTFKYANDIAQFSKKYSADVLDKTMIELKSDALEETLNSTFFNLYVAWVRQYGFPGNASGNRNSINEHFLLSVADSTISIYITEKLMFDGLEWIDLYNDYYAIIYDYLQYSRIITYQLRLNYYNYSRILSSGKIYDKNLGRELTVLKINKYNPNGLTDLIAVTREI